MNNLNSVLIDGNLTKDPALSYTKAGTAVTTFSIAVNRQYRSNDDEYKEEVAYLEIESWGKTAENCNEFLKKGRGVRVVGRLKQERWESTGSKHSKIIIIAEHVEFKPNFKAPTKEPATVV